MRKYALLAAAAGLAVSGSLARADFVISSTRTDLSTPVSTGSATAPGFQLVEFFAKSTNTGGVLTSESLTVTDKTGNNLLVGYTDSSEATVDYSGGSMIHTNGSKSSAPTAYVFNNAVDTTTGAPHIYSAITILGDPTNTAENSAGSPNILALGGTNSPATVSNSYQVGSISLQVANTASDNSSNVGVNATTANGGNGALIALAVVPTGDVVNVSGILNEGTAASNINATNPVPEPASLGVLGLGAVGLLARRRRRA